MDDAGVPRANSAILPPPSVLRAFRLSGPLEPLPGGRGSSVRVRDVVLKPVDDFDDVAWTAQLMDGLKDRTDFRVPDFVRSIGGDHVVDGWAATRFLAGEPGPVGRWSAVLAAGRAFHRALRDVPRPDRLDELEHPWAVADRIAWGERTAALPAEVGRLVTRLQTLRRPVDARDQLIHGDLTGNVLFAPGESPAIIDFSPFWRPVAYADAIVVVDGLLYHRVGLELIDSALPGPDGAQLLLRAVIFRLAASGLIVGPDGVPAEEELLRFTCLTRFVADRVGD